MTITIFVNPDCINEFILVTSMLKDLPLDNGYKFQPEKLIFTHKLISDYLWITMDVSEYAKLRYCIDVLEKEMK